MVIVARVAPLVGGRRSAMLASAKTSSNETTLWKTLSGNAPLVIARGGFSGLFSDSGGKAYEFARQNSLSNVIYRCDVQLTKDGAGVCFPDLTLENASNIIQINKNKSNTYYVDGVKTSGSFLWISPWMTWQMSFENLARGPYFNGIYKILTVQAVATLYPPELWLNVEVSFLKSILADKPSKTKLIFRFRGQAEVELSTNQPYGYLLWNLSLIKIFASGILVPKTYIWPVDSNRYLQPHTSIVSDAHKGLEVFASDFANDLDFAYNFAYDPLAEYLQFVDNGNFSVDGVVSDFPITPSEAIGCFSRVGNRTKAQGNPLVISLEGYGGHYPGCTDLAYQTAISDGVAALDCPVKMSRDGIPFCLGFINLKDKTKVAESNFDNLTSQIPELEGISVVFTVSLIWSEIRSLKRLGSQGTGNNPVRCTSRLIRACFTPTVGCLILPPLYSVDSKQCLSSRDLNVSNGPAPLPRGEPAGGSAVFVSHSLGYVRRGEQRLAVGCLNTPPETASRFGVASFSSEMWKLWLLLHLLHLCSAMLASAKTSGNGTTLWKTLSGNAPLVIARGGFSGLFPDSSGKAYEFARQTSLPNVIYWCDVQLTKDGAGICFPHLTLENASNIIQISKNKSNTYYVNGVKTSGWFSVDFTISDLAHVTLTQETQARTPDFDGIYKILTVQVVATLYPPELWLNVEHDAFFSQRGLSMRSYILSVFRSTKVDYISSPEVSFLRSMLAHKPSKTKLIFRFPGQAEVEPSTNQTYGSLLRNLTLIKTFASGILVPKTYIWPVDSDRYLQPHTSIVSDAHKEGLEVFASDFANDFDFAYNFAYDPLAEYLHFIDNGNFSVDGVVSDFPITPSEAIGCFSHIGKRTKTQANPLVISSEGYSGYYPGCTDLAYQTAISDGVDVLDCPVQMSKDGIPFCLGSINLNDRTNVAESDFHNLTSRIPELEGVTGIFTFSLTWNDIRSLKPEMSKPYTDYKLYRNPNFSEDVKLMTLSELLVLANNANSVSGVLISIENAAYLVEKQGLSVIDAVVDALKNASHNNNTVKKVMIQSTDSAVLIKLREKSNYELVYNVEDAIRDADNLTIAEIKKFANSVAVKKGSVLSFREAYITSITDVVSKLQAFNLSVYVGLFRNEFVSLAQDFLADANVGINTFVALVQIDGIITEFPGTASRYKRNRCLGLGAKKPTYMNPVRPGELLSSVPPLYLPPAEAPSPVLTEDDVIEPPLPPVEKAPAPGNGSTAAAAPAPANGEAKVPPPFFLSHLAALLATLVFL